MDISTSFSGSYLESWALHALSRDVECGERASVNPASESLANRLTGGFWRLSSYHLEKESGESQSTEKVDMESGHFPESGGNPKAGNSSPKAGFSSTIKDEEGPPTARAWETG